MLSKTCISPEGHEVSDDVLLGPPNFLVPFQLFTRSHPSRPHSKACVGAQTICPIELERH